jgi:hypothetical protein
MRICWHVSMSFLGQTVHLDLKEFPRRDELLEALRRFARPVDGTATSPAGLALSEKLLRRLHPELFGVRGGIHDLVMAPEQASSRISVLRLEEHMRMGDSNPAIVIQKTPLIIAAYSYDLDAVLLLRLPDELATRHGFEVGDRLLSINTYGKGLPARDIEKGAEATGWDNFHPVIAELACEDEATIAVRKKKIDERFWLRAEEMGRAKLARQDIPPRDGLPARAHIPSVGAR